MVISLQANQCQEPVEVYKHMNSNSIGKQCAAYYKAWALCTEELGQTKAADQIFLQGIEAGAQPLDELKKARSLVFETQFTEEIMAVRINSQAPIITTHFKCICFILSYSTQYK